MIFRRLDQRGAQAVERAVFSSVVPVAHAAPWGLAGRQAPHQRSGIDVKPCQCRSQWIMPGEH